ncbi:hypothetical protein V5O48_016562 [Marasmius crinis-equi]|uniref:Uncharacterized protein n=1 Tax=Marasmius crinis-equi TaxID=585013 RepID=A0ABR3ERE6_9AGAR
MNGAANEKTHGTTTIRKDLNFFSNLRCNHYPPYYSILGINTFPSTESDAETKETELDVLLLGVTDDDGNSVRSWTRSRASSLASSVSGAEELFGGHELGGAMSENEDKDHGLQQEEGAGEVDDVPGCSIDTELPDPFSDSEDAAGREYFSAATLQIQDECWKELMSVAGSSNGVHPRMAKVLKQAFSMMKTVGQDIQKEKRQ